MKNDSCPDHKSNDDGSIVGLSSHFLTRKRRHAQLSTFDEDTWAKEFSSNEIAIISKSLPSAVDSPQLIWDDDASDEESICFRKESKRTKRNFNYFGWLEPSTLKAVAARYGGTAIQFRVRQMYWQAEDSSSEGMVLVVESVFASMMGNMRIQIQRFLNWKLPHATNRPSIYKDFRPWFHGPGTSLNSCPSITLDANLHPEMKTIVSTFLELADPGMTPGDFFQNEDLLDIVALIGDNHDISRFNCDYHFELETIPQSGHVKPCVRDEQLKNLESLHQHPTRMPHCRLSPGIDVDSELGSHPFDDQTSDEKITCVPNSVNKQGTTNVLEQKSLHNGDEKEGNVDTWVHYVKRLPSEPKKQKRFGTQANGRDRTEVTFDIDVPNTSQFLVLVECLAESPFTTCCDSSHCWPTSGPIQGLPRTGRLVDLLPNLALSGSWIATEVHCNRKQRRLSGFTRRTMRELKGLRIALRHNCYLDVGMLKDGTTMSSQSGAVNGNLHVSIIDPSIGRCKDLRSQGVVNENGTTPVVGSISIVSCAGFTSSSEASSEIAGGVASSYLEAFQRGLNDLIATADCTSTDARNLFPIAFENLQERAVSRDVGVSFLCELSSNDSYHVLVAQDSNGKVVAIDVVFHPQAPRSNLSSDVTSSLVEASIKSAENLKRVADRLIDIDPYIHASNLSNKEHQSQDDNFRFSSDPGFESEIIVPLVSMKESQFHMRETSSVVTPRAPSQRQLLTSTSMKARPVEIATCPNPPLVTPFTERIWRASQGEASSLNLSEKTLVVDDVNHEEFTTSRFRQRPNNATISECWNNNANAYVGDEAIIFSFASDVPRPQLRWNKSHYLLFLTILFVSCIRLPKDQLRQALSRANNLSSDITVTTQVWLAQIDSVQLPMVYSVVGSEWMSLLAIAMITTMYGR